MRGVGGINTFQTTAPVSASPLQFCTSIVALQVTDTAGNESNIVSATFQVQ
jgi:hypothetical protein